ncbi:MAG: MFS transporter [Pseudomonadales bacterium]|jgi:MFS family permease
MEGGLFYGWKVVAALFVILAFTSGLGFYNHSVLLTALSDEAGFPLTIASSAVSVFFFVSGLSGLVIGSLLEKYDVRIIITFGAILASGALAALAYVKEVWQLYLLYTIFGIGFSASSLLPATTLVARWFHKSRAKALSIASTGLSIGGVLITPISAAVVSTNGIVVASPWLGAVYFLGVVPICLIVLRSEPATLGLMPDGGSRDSDASPVFDGVTLAQAARQRYFWTLSISYLFVMLAQVGAIAHQYGIISQHYQTGEAAIAIAVLPLFSIIGRLAGGILVDMFSTSKFTIFMMILQCFALALMASAESSSMLIVGLAVFGITVGNLLMLQPLLLADVYGLRQYSRIYAWSNFITILGISVGPTLLGFLTTYDDSYSLSFAVAASSSLIACGVFLLSRPPVFQQAE